jgi:hypothetical protein
MEKPTLSYVTVDKAITLMLGFKHVLNDVSMFDTLNVFLQDAEIEYEKFMLDSYSAVVDACDTRLKMAESFSKAIKMEIAKADSTFFVLSKNKSNEDLIELESLGYWASIKFGIEILPAITRVPTKEATWEKVKIRIYKDYLVRPCIDGVIQKISDFRSMKLMGMRKNTPNKQGVILMGYLRNYKFPKGIKPTSSDKKSMSELRTVIRNLTGVPGDPFFNFNEADGWKPKFHLENCMRSQDDRAKNRAQHISYDYNNESESRPFEDQNDEAGLWLQENS